MKTLIAALGIVMLISSTSFAGWYVGPTMVQTYYPMAPAYAYPAPVVAAPAPYVAYMPVATPVVTYYGSPVVAPVPVYVGRPAVVRSKVYYPGQPVRNVVKAVVP
jgi:hypothetical protein